MKSLVLFFTFSLVVTACGPRSEPLAQLNDDPELPTVRIELDSVHRIDSGAQIWAASFDPESPDAAVVAAGGDVTYLDLPSIRPHWNYRFGHRMEISKALISPNGRVVAHGSGFEEGSGKLRLLSMTDGSLLREIALADADGWLDSLNWSPDGRFIALGSYDDGKVRLFDATTLRLERTLESAGGAVYAISFSPDGRFLYGSVGSDLHLWNLESGALVWSYDARWWNAGETYVFSPDSRYIAAGAGTDAILIDVATRQIVQRVGPHPSHVTAVAFTPDLCCVVSAGENTAGRTEMKLWDIATGTVLQTVVLNAADGFEVVAGASVSRDGSKLMLTTRQSLRIYKLIY